MAGSTFEFFGQTWGYGDLDAFKDALRAHGDSYATWADNHPDAALILTYNPYAYVPGGSSPAVAAAIVAAATQPPAPPPEPDPAPPPPQDEPAPPEPTVPYNPEGYVPGGSSAAVGQAIEAQAIAQPGPNPVQVPASIEASIPPETLVSTPGGGVETFQQSQTAGPPAPVPASTVALNGLDAVNELFRQAGLHDVDPLAAAAVALHEGAGGGIGDYPPGHPDEGTAYGPWQIHLADGRLPAFASMPSGSAELQAWAWSSDGFAYAFRSMVDGGAGGISRHPAIHAIVYGFERPANEPAEYDASVSTYDDLSSYTGDVRALLAPQFKGAGGPISGTGLQGAPAPPLAQPAQPRPAGVSNAWDDLLTVGEVTIPVKADAVASLGDSLRDVFGG